MNLLLTDSPGLRAGRPLLLQTTAWTYFCAPPLLGFLDDPFTSASRPQQPLLPAPVFRTSTLTSLPLSPTINSKHHALDVQQAPYTLPAQDGFLLQVEGQKRWRYNPEVEEEGCAHQWRSAYPTPQASLGRCLDTEGGGAGGGSRVVERMHTGIEVEGYVMLRVPS